MSCTYFVGKLLTYIVMFHYLTKLFKKKILNIKKPIVEQHITDPIYPLLTLLMA